MKVLHIDSSILGGNSVSRLLSAAIVAKIAAAHPDAHVTYRDLALTPLPHLTGAHLMAAGSTEGATDPAIAADLEAGRAAMREFLAADTVVIGAPLYNFTISTQLKAWIDRIVVAGQTFRYRADGRPEGLAGGKHAILAIARGGFYGPESPVAAFEHAETYLRTALGFIGIANPEVVVAEGIAISPNHRQAAIASAEARIAALAV